MVLFVTWLLIPVGLYIWAKWYWILFARPLVGRPWRRRWTLVLTPIACLVVLAFSEFRLTADVRLGNHFVYTLVLLYEFAWLGIAQGLFPYLGVSPLADGVSRDNHAARIATVGGLVGAAFALSLARTDTDQATLFLLFDLIGLAIYLLGWGLLESAWKVSDRVTILRDPGSALWLSAGLMAWGLASGALANGIELFFPRGR